jgi:ribose transport system permease protein
MGSGVSPSPPTDVPLQDDVATPSAPRGGWREVALELLSRYAVLVALILMVVVYSALLPDTFFTTSNLTVITGSQSVLIVAVLGLILPFSAGEFDLSFGSVIAWAATMMAVLNTNLHVNGWIALLAVLASCIAWGVLNAVFIVGLGVSSLITTLGTGTLIIGLTLAISGSQVVSNSWQLLTSVTTNELFGLPYPVYFSFLLATIVWLLLEHTPAGRYLYFTGEGREVSRLSGLPVNRIRTIALIASSGLCGLAGIINLGHLGSADPNLGTTFLLPGTAAVFLGATVIKPGRFNAWGTMVAVFLLVTGVTGLELLGGAGWIEDVFNGAALVLAVSFARIVSREPARTT